MKTSIPNDRASISDGDVCAHMHDTAATYSPLAANICRSNSED